MPTILAYTSPARGHLYPMMDVLLELQQRGHRIVVQTLAAEKPAIEATGLEHRPILPDIEALELHDHQGSNPLSQFQIAVDTWLQRAPHEVTDLKSSIDALQPDFLLIDANTFGAAAVAEACGLPWALHMPYCLPTPSRDAPAFGPGFPPPKNAIDRLRDSAGRTLLNLAMRSHVQRLNNLRGQLGARPVAHLTDTYDLVPTILYRTAEPFEYPRSDWATNVHCLGPGLWAPAADVPEWLLELPEPRILVNISTEAQNDGKIVQTAIDALGDQAGSLVCTTSAQSPETFRNTSPNVRVVKFLPHAQILPHIACVVTHGGMGTVQRALAEGVPVCVVPWGRDQNETAQRTVVANAGTRLNPSKLDPTHLRKAVQNALTKTVGARAVADGFRQAGGASRCADMIERAFG